MMTVILPDTDIPIKTLDEPTDGSGAIVIRLGLDGILTVEILADESDEADELLKVTQPVLELLRKMFTGKRI